MPTVYATFENPDAAGKAVDELIAAGFSPDDISLSVSNPTRQQSFPSHDDRGGTVATWTGGLAGAGASDQVAQDSEGDIPQGALVVAVVAADDRTPSVEAILRRGEGTLHPA